MASIRKRPRKDGTIIWAVLWRDADTGKQTSRSLFTEADAKMLKDFLDANNQSFALAAEAAGKLRSNAPALSEILEEHIDLLTNISPGTRGNYRRQAALHIVPTLGAIPVDKITRSDVARWMNQLPLAAKTKKNVHSILSAALKSAVIDGHISENPAAGLRAAAELKTREPVFLSEAQMLIIYNPLPTMWRLFVELLVNSGLRFGEATALRWRDIDFYSERAIVMVTRAWKRGEDGKMYVGPPKTRKSRRRVSLPIWLTKKLRDARGDAKLDDLIFLSPGGFAVTSGYFHTNVWIPLMRQVEGALGVRPTVHDLRHTHASRLIQKGIPLPVIQARLGHESITTTVNTYGHLAHNADALAAAALD